MILWFPAKKKKTIPNILGGVYNLLKQDWKAFQSYAAEIPNLKYH